ncbi:MAG TPA: hypothetical protein VJS91_12180, partial [Nitrososphaeraceae archaeon]|nr:hypothetical protein [Nitrososphaeraceae archaeon]
AVNFNTIRPGTLYSNNKKPKPFSGPSNGIVIALGDIDSNKEFFNYSNELALFLLRDKTIKSVLGSNFRKKLPSVWWTLGYYHKPGTSRINNKLENIFKQYDNMRGNSFKFSISEISLVSSRYKNLRRPTILYKFKV